MQSLLPRIAIWLAIPAFLIGLAALVLWFPFYWPTVVVKASSEAVAPSAGMPLSFAIENVGRLKAHTVTFRCYFGRVRGIPPIEVDMDDDYTTELPVSDALLPSDPIEVSCPGVGAPVKDADVAILVSFRPSFDWRHSVACSRYALDKNSGGQLAWFRKSSGPCNELNSCLKRRDAVVLQHKVAVREYEQKRRAGIAVEPPDLHESYESCLPKE